MWCTQRVEEEVLLPFADSANAVSVSGWVVGVEGLSLDECALRDRR